MAIKRSRDAEQAIPTGKERKLRTKSIIQQGQGEGKRNPKIEQIAAELEFALLNRPLTRDEVAEHNDMVRRFNASQARRVQEEAIIQLWNEGMMPNAIASKLQCDLGLVESTIECQGNYEGVTV